MARPISIVKPDEAVKMRRGKTPLATRVRQTITAIEVLRTKGAEQFTATQVAQEIDRRLQSGHVMNAMYALLERGAVACLTPDKKVDRVWGVADAAKLAAFRVALEGGEEVLPPAPAAALGLQSSGAMEALPWYRRLARWLHTPVGGNSATRMQRLEDRLARLEERFDHLLSALGGE